MPPGIKPSSGTDSFFLKLNKDKGLDMKKTLHTLAASLAVGLGSGAVMAAEQVNIICSVQAEWCNMISSVYARSTGTKVNMSMKGSGESLAQLIAEKENPKTDIWFGGTGDPHLQAAEQGLTLEYKSPTLPQLYPWAQQQAQQSQQSTGGQTMRRTGGSTSGGTGGRTNRGTTGQSTTPAPSTPSTPSAPTPQPTPSKPSGTDGATVG